MSTEKGAGVLFGRERHCSDEDLNAYLDDELDAGVQERCSAHVVACEACATTLEGLRTLRLSLRTLPIVVAPRSFKVRQAQVEVQRSARKPVLVRAMPLLSGVSVVALVAFLALAGLTATGGGDDATAELSSVESVEEGAAADSAAPSGLVPEAANDETQGALQAPTTVGAESAMYDAGTPQAREADDSLSATTAPPEEEDAATSPATAGGDADNDTLLYVAMGLTAALAVASGGLAFTAWRQRS